MNMNSLDVTTPHRDVNTPPTPRSSERDTHIGGDTRHMYPHILTHVWVPRGEARWGTKEARLRDDSVEKALPGRIPQTPPGTPT